MGRKRKSTPASQKTENKKLSMEDVAKKFAKKAKAEGAEVLDTQKKSGNIDTGSYALNAIISGSLFKGIPDNKTIALCGPSNTGKSFVLAQIIKGSQDAGFLPIVFDSERAVERDYYERIGANTKAMVRYPVSTHMDFRNAAYNQIKEFAENNPEVKLLVALDSLGNLAGDKEISDTEKGKAAADMGTNAKQMNSAFRVINSIVSKYNIPFIFTNHVYENPAAMFAGRGKMSGGSKAIYNSHIIIHFEKAQLKEQITTEEGKVVNIKTGLYMNASTVKNRVVPEEQKASIEVRFRTGMTKFYGLLNYALGAGVFEKIDGKNGIYVPHLDKHVSEKKLYNETCFTPDVLTAIDKYVSKVNSYSSFTDEQMESIEREMLADEEE